VLEFAAAGEGDGDIVPAVSGSGTIEATRNRSTSAAASVVSSAMGARAASDWGMMSSPDRCKTGPILANRT
jgi:hypothetical protein